MHYYHFLLPSAPRYFGLPTQYFRQVYASVHNPRTNSFTAEISSCLKMPELWPDLGTKITEHFRINIRLAITCIIFIIVAHTYTASQFKTKH